MHDLRRGSPGRSAGLLLGAVAGLMAGLILATALSPIFDSSLRQHRWGANQNADLRFAEAEVVEEARWQLSYSLHFGLIVTFASFALVLTFMLIVMDALKRQQPPSWVGGALGLVTAAFVAGLGAELGHMLFRLLERHAPETGAFPIHWTMAFQIPAWIFVGIGTGFGIAWSSRGSRQLFDTLPAGISAGVLFGAIYPVLASIAFPEHEVAYVIPSNSVVEGVWLLGWWAGGAGLILGSLIAGVRCSVPTPTRPEDDASRDHEHAEEHTYDKTSGPSAQ